MTATKTVKTTRLDLVKKIADKLWDYHNIHVYTSSVMTEPKGERFVCSCYTRGDSSCPGGYMTVIFNKDYVSGMFVQVLLPNKPLQSFVPVLDFPGW